jgi:hypothetical protein
MSRSALVVLAALGLPATALAQAAPLAGEPQFQVNSYTENVQFRPALGVADDGSFVVAWRSAGAEGATNTAPRIQGIRIDARGQAVGPELTLDEGVPCTFQWSYCRRDEPSLAVLPSGGFVAVWSYWDFEFPGPELHAIRGRRFASDGAPLGPEFVVSPISGGSGQGVPSAPVASVDGGGGFVVAWAQDDPPYDGTAEIFARRYDAAGDPLGPEFRVNSYIPGNQLRPRIAHEPGGGFAIVWQSRGDGSGTSIMARRFDATGAALGLQFQVNTIEAGNQLRSGIGFDAQGDFVIAWESWAPYGGDTSEGSVQAQRFAADGTRAGVQFQVNETTAGEQGFPAVAVEPDGHFVVAWWSVGGVPPPSEFDPWWYGGIVRARRFDPLGVPVGPEVQVNRHGVASRMTPALAAVPGGKYVLAWGSDVGSDGDELDSIEARRLTGDWIFLDGFETTDPSRWSLTAP